MTRARILRMSAGGAVLICAAAQAGTITGHARFEKIAGKPQAGYAELYESDLFLSPATNAMTGPSRRLGAPPGQAPTNDGFYSIPNLPAGKYSVLVNQPDFFIAPKVAHDINLGASETKTLNIDLDVDYSTAFATDQQWTDWQWDWTQTFKATGTSVTGFSFRVAGTTPNNDALIIFRKDNGSANPLTWPVVATARKSGVGSNTDNWVRFRSGQVPLSPGTEYAVQVHVDGGFAPYKRNKDSLSYANGIGYQQNGTARDFDLNYTVFVDKSDTLVTMNKRETGIGVLDSGGFSTRWGQTFVANGTSLASVDVFAAGGSTWDLPFTWSVRDTGPNGAQIGPSKTTAAAFFATTTGLHAVSYSRDEVPLVPGHTYYIEFSNSSGFNPLLLNTDRYDAGIAYKNGVAQTTRDLSMTILEYKAVPEPGAMALCLLPLALLRRKR